MIHCNESSQPGTGGVALHPLARAGLRRPPPDVEPTAGFVVIEMAVLFCVTALAMVSIIVSIDDDLTGQRAQHVARLDDRLRPVEHARAVLPPSDYSGQGAPRTSTAEGIR